MKFQKFPAAATALALALTITSAACSGSVRYALLGGREYSTTEGEARFEERDGGGYTMTVEMDRLPTAERLGMPSAHFMVWTRESTGAIAVRVAELAVDPSTRTGRASANVPSHSLELLVTAETSGDATEPGTTVLVDAVLDPAD